MMAVQQDFRTNRADYLIAKKAIVVADGVGAKKTSPRLIDPRLAKLTANRSKSSPDPSRDGASELFHSTSQPKSSVPAVRSSGATWHLLLCTNEKRERSLIASWSLVALQLRLECWLADRSADQLRDREPLSNAQLRAQRVRHSCQFRYLARCREPGKGSGSRGTR